jgi:parallel beta-helix repeat protein
MKAIMAAVLALLLFSVSSVAFDAVYVTASPKTIRVPQDYQTIQEAINWASAGDTIMVAAGTYHENVVVREAVSIIGEDRNTTIIDGGGSEIEPVVSIEANNVSFTGFTIQNGYRGIMVVSSGNSLVNNTVKDNRGEGILLFSHGNILRHNNLEDNTYNFAVHGLMFFWGPMPPYPYTRWMVSRFTIG